MGKYIFFLLVLTLSLGLKAQTEQEPPQEEQDLEGVVVRAFNASRRLLATPGSISMIGSLQIEQAQGASILPVLNQASGVFAHSGTLSTSRITIRGIGARVPYGTGKIRAYFNNIPLTNGSGVSIVEYIDPAVIERIEIIKGPATSAYGAGLGGTISITSRQPFLRPAGISNSLSLGSFGLFRNTTTLDFGTCSLASSLIYNRTSSDGFRENNRYRRDALTSVTQLRMGDRTRATLLLYYSDVLGHIPSSIDSLTFVTMPSAAARNWANARGYNDTRALLAGVAARHQLQGDLFVDVSIFSTIHDEMERRPWDFLYEDRRSAGIRLSAGWMALRGLSQWQLLAGAELFFENFRYSTYENPEALGIQGDIISRNREWIRYTNLFLQADLERGALNLSAGMNLNNNHIDYHDLVSIGGINRSAPFSYPMILSPRISANYRFIPFHAIFATISHGFSPPALSETLTPDGFVNPDIRPEKSWNLETGIRGSILDNRIYYDLSLYSMFVRDLLVAQRIGEDAWVGRNAGRSLHQGIELEVQGRLWQARQASSFWQIKTLPVRVAASYNHFRFTDYVDNDVDHSGNQIPGIPSFFLNTEIRLVLARGLYAGADLRLAGSMPMNDANTRFSQPYGVAGASLGYLNSFGSWEMDLFARVDNLFDKHYASMILVNAPSFGSPPRYYYPGYPVNFSVGLRIGLHRMKQ